IPDSINALRADRVQNIRHTQITSGPKVNHQIWLISRARLFLVRANAWSGGNRLIALEQWLGVGLCPGASGIGRSDPQIAIDIAGDQAISEKIASRIQYGQRRKPVTRRLELDKTIVARLGPHTIQTTLHIEHEEAGRRLLRVIPIRHEHGPALLS